MQLKLWEVIDGLEYIKEAAGAPEEVRKGIIKNSARIRTLIQQVVY